MSEGGKRWWTLPKFFTSMPIWRETNEERIKSKLNNKSGQQTKFSNCEKIKNSADSDDDEDIEEFIEKQRNARLGYSSNGTPFHSVQKSEEYFLSADEKSSSENFFKIFDRKQFRSHSEQYFFNNNGSLSKISVASGRSISEFGTSKKDVGTYMSCERFNSDQDEKIEVVVPEDEIQNSVLEIDAQECVTEFAEKFDCDLDRFQIDSKPNQVDGKKSNPGRHVTKLTITLNPITIDELNNIEVEEESNEILNSNEPNSTENEFENLCIKNDINAGNVEECDLIRTNENRSSDHSDYAEVIFLDGGENNMEYCHHLAEMKTITFGERTLKKFKRRRVPIGRVNDGISKAWKSLRGWWIDEKIRIEQAVIKTHNKIVKCEKSILDSSDGNTVFGELIWDDKSESSSTKVEALSFQTDDEAYCTSYQATTDSNSQFSDSTKQISLLNENFRPQSCYADIGGGENSLIRKKPPYPPPSRNSRISGIRRSKYVQEGQDGFEELRRYIKQGGDFCKDLNAILQERSEAEIQYAKTLSKLSSKLMKVTKDSIGTVGQAWKKTALEMEITSEIHKAFATALSDEVVKPLKQLIESQHRIKKSVETAVDKTSKSLSEWRSAESKSKKQSFMYARENEKLQDLMLDARLNGTLTHSCKLTASTLHLHHQRPSSEKECSKLEAKRKKAEDCVKKSDVQYYTYCIRAERSRLEWETAVVRGSQCFQALEEERLQQLKNLLYSYWQQCLDIGPKLMQSASRLKEPIENCDVCQDIKTVASLKGVEHPVSEQILPDFYAEHMALAMNRDRRRQALVKILQLIIHDLERERRGKNGVENLARAFKQTPNFGTDGSQQNVSEKLHHMRFMLTYLEAARYKVTNALAELDGKPKASHPLATHIHVIRDRQGFQQSVLKVPPWIYRDYLDSISNQIESSSDWNDRGNADGNSIQPDSDFDEFSSQSSSSEKDYDGNIFTVLADSGSTAPSEGKQCKALYHYSANLYDELNLEPGDVINIREKQADGWWLGELNGVIGIFPATYVQEIS